MTNENGATAPSRRAEQESAEGARMGAKYRAKQDARHRVEQYRALLSSGATLTDAQSYDYSESVAELGDAESKSAERGRPGEYSPGTAPGTMPESVLVKMSRGAAAVELARLRRGGIRMDRAERQERQEDAAAAAVTAGMELAARTAGAAWFTAPYGSERADRRLARLSMYAEHGAMRGLTPPWRALDGAVPGKLARDRWTYFLRAAARRHIEREERAKITAPPVDRRGRRAARVREQNADAKATVAALSAAVGGMARIESYGARVALDGLTHRERAAQDDESFDVAVNRAKRGAKRLRQRFPTAAALRAEVRAAERARYAAEQDGADAYRAALVRLPWWRQDAESAELERTTLTDARERGAAALRVWSGARRNVSSAGFRKGGAQTAQTAREYPATLTMPPATWAGIRRAWESVLAPLYPPRTAPAPAPFTVVYYVGAGSILAPVEAYPAGMLNGRPPGLRDVPRVDVEQDPMPRTVAPAGTPPRERCPRPHRRTLTAPDADTRGAALRVITARRAARTAERTAAEQGGKLTVLAPVERTRPGAAAAPVTA